MEPVAGMRLVRDDGAQIRIDSVERGEVYFVTWLPGQEYGSPKRMPIEEFRAACAEHRLSVTQHPGVRP